MKKSKKHSDQDANDKKLLDFKNNFIKYFEKEILTDNFLASLAEKSASYDKRNKEEEIIPQINDIVSFIKDVFTSPDFIYEITRDVHYLKSRHINIITIFTNLVNLYDDATFRDHPVKVLGTNRLFYYELLLKVNKGFAITLAKKISDTLDCIIDKGHFEDNDKGLVEYYIENHKDLWTKARTVGAEGYFPERLYSKLVVMLRKIEENAEIEKDDEKSKISYSRTTFGTLISNGMLYEKEACDLADKYLSRFPKLKIEIPGKKTKFYINLNALKETLKNEASLSHINIKKV